MLRLRRPSRHRGQWRRRDSAEPAAFSPRRPLLSDVTAHNRRLLAERAAQAGADVAAAAFRRQFDVERKGDPVDLVTDVDRRAQEAVVEAIRAADGDAVVVAEEDDAPTAVPEDGTAWIVDPIDGTRNFVAGSRVWATSVAVVEDGEPVAAATLMPALGDGYVLGPDGVTRSGAPVGPSDVDEASAALAAPLGVPASVGAGEEAPDRFESLCRALLGGVGDLRRVGCAQATLAMVASGELDAAVATDELDPWDTVAGAAMVAQAGGRVTDLDGEPWRHDAEGLVATNGRLHEAVRGVVRDAGP